MSRISKKLVWLATILIFSGCGSNNGWGDRSSSDDLAVVAVPETATIDDQIKELQSGVRNEFQVTSSLTAKQIAQLKRSAEKINKVEASEFSDIRSLLPALSNLQSLKIDGPVSDADFEQIYQIASLQWLNLPEGDLSNKGLSGVRNLKNLVSLRFGSKRVTDKGLTALKSLSSLRFLHLLAVPITDKSLPVIAKLKKLESFYLDGGKATEDGLVKFSKSRPDVHFHKDQLHLDGTGH